MKINDIITEAPKSKKIRRKPTFKKITDFDTWSRHGEYSEVELEGYLFGVLYDDKYLIGLWYNSAGFGTLSSDFARLAPKGEDWVEEYTRDDPYCPYNNDENMNESDDEYTDTEQAIGQLTQLKKSWENSGNTDYSSASADEISAATYSKEITKQMNLLIRMMYSLKNNTFPKEPTVKTPSSIDNNTRNHSGLNSTQMANNARRRNHQFSSSIGGDASNYKRNF